MKRSLLFSTMLLIVAIPVVLFLGMNTGVWNLSPGEVLDLIFAPESLSKVIVRDLRLTRVLMAMLSGGLLTLGGFMMQALVRNPLADPYIMGLSAGAGFGANLRLLGIITVGSFALLPLYAFIGACLSLGLLLLLGFRHLASNSTRLLIAGIAVSSFFVALTGLMIYTAQDSEDLRAVIFWSFGSFAGTSWDAIWVSLILLTVLWGFGLVNSHRLDLISMGDLQARSLGMRTGYMKLLILGLTSLCVGGSIAYTGPVGFVGLMVPHFSRSLLGGLHRPNLIFGTLLGAVFLAVCDLISQLIYPPVGLPIGILTALLGVPFFLQLLFSNRHRI